MFKRALLITLIVPLLLLLIASPAYLQTPTVTPTPTATPFVEPTGCLRPSEDYTRLEVNGSILNQRMFDMLAHAQTLYSGTIDLTGRAVTQGSYTGGALALSFGTHDGGGAVDISVRNLPVDWTILWDDIPLVITALRTAGFAAWFRDEDDDMTPHIHAVAIGDAELSRAAQLQLTGRYGYFRGYDALPQIDGVPQPDMDGELILCQWMLDAGYVDLRDETELVVLPYTFTIGDAVLTNTVWGEELNMRTEPGLSSTIVTKLPPETPVTILDGPRDANGYRWWQIQTEDGTIGWSVDSSDGGLTLVK